MHNSDQQNCTGGFSFPQTSVSQGAPWEGCSFGPAKTDFHFRKTQFTNDFKKGFSGESHEKPIFQKSIFESIDPKHSLTSIFESIAAKIDFPQPPPKVAKGRPPPMALVALPILSPAPVQPAPAKRSFPPHPRPNLRRVDHRLWPRSPFTKIEPRPVSSQPACRRLHRPRSPLLAGSATAHTAGRSRQSARTIALKGRDLRPRPTVSGRRQATCAKTRSPPVG